MCRQRAVAVVIRAGCVLMVLHREGERVYWTLPGGGVEPGESAIGAAVRELAEETGIRAKAVRELYRLPSETCYLCDADLAQMARLGSDPELDGQPAMVLAVGWIPLSELEDDVQGRLFLPALEGDETGS